MRRDDPRLQIITEAIERLIPGAAPVNLTVHVDEGLASGDQNTWSGRPDGLAVKIFTALYGRPDTSPGLSPLAQSDAAHGRRDIGAMVEVLSHADHQLTHAPWYPVRPGDLVHVHFEASGLTPAFGETYVIGDAGAPGDAPGGLMSMQLLAHTFEGGHPDEFGVGSFAADAADDPLYTAWFEAGPQRLTIVRDGQVVHGTLARPETDAAAAGAKLAAMTMAAAIREAEQYLERGEPGLALERLRSDVPLAPCGAPGFTAEQADCARPSGHRGACSDNADYTEPPHECPEMPGQLHTVVYVDHPGRSVRFGGLYADQGAALEVANDAACGYGSALTETTPGPGGQPLILLPAEGVAGVPVVAVVGLQLLPDPRAELAWAQECRDALLSPEDDDYGDPGDGDYDADQNGEA